MSDCTAIYPANPIECLLGEGHDGDHAGEDSAGFQFRWSKPNADMVPAARLDAANLEIARLRLALDAEHRRCVAVVHDVAQKHRKPDGTRTVEGYGALDAWDALASAKPDVFRTITPKESSDV